MIKTLLQEIAEKRPKLAKEAKTSRKSAILLFCLTCVGGSTKDVKDCTAVTCPLYSFRAATSVLKGKEESDEKEY